VVRIQGDGRKRLKVANVKDGSVDRKGGAEGEGVGLVDEGRTGLKERNERWKGKLCRRPGLRRRGAVRDGRMEREGRRRLTVADVKDGSVSSRVGEGEAAGGPRYEGRYGLEVPNGRCKVTLSRFPGPVGIGAVRVVRIQGDGRKRLKVANVKDGS